AGAAQEPSAKQASQAPWGNHPSARAPGTRSKGVSAGMTAGPSRRGCPASGVSAPGRAPSPPTFSTRGAGGWRAGAGTVAGPCSGTAGAVGRVGSVGRARLSRTADGARGAPASLGAAGGAASAAGAVAVPGKAALPRPSAAWRGESWRSFSKAKRSAILELTSASGAQTRRRGDAGPVRILLGGVTSPAVFVLLTNRTILQGEGAHRTGHGQGPAGAPLPGEGGGPGPSRRVLFGGDLLSFGRRLARSPRQPARREVLSGDLAPT